jgi:hypothetical protein
MGAFELQETTPVHAEPMVHPIPQKIKDECIIAFKIYDSCRHQNCLTDSEIGPARAAESVNIGDECLKEGDIICPPKNAASVTIDNLKVKRIIIVDKQPSPFRNGYWDVDIKYVFEYRLTFREVDGKVISSAKASSIFNMKLTLFGSVGADLVVGTDMLTAFSESLTFDAEPFICVEAKAVALHAKIQQGGRPLESRQGHCHGEVHVSIGLFAIVKLFRMVNLNVQSKGFCIPEECGDCNPICPCEHFEEMDFPMDIFAPPQKPEFLAGTGINIPKAVL